MFYNGERWYFGGKYRSARQSTEPSSAVISLSTVWRPIQRGLIVESKWQDVSGTADEKFPYLVANIRHCYPLPTVVVASGNGARPGAIAWLRSRVDGTQFVAVQSIEDFVSWILRADRCEPAQTLPL